VGVCYIISHFRPSLISDIRAEPIVDTYSGASKALLVTSGSTHWVGPSSARKYKTEDRSAVSLILD